MGGEAATRMRLLAPVKARLFLGAWLVFALHFATNIRREHYPAFSIAERLSFQCDRYYGLHPDIFWHTDGHAYINNQVTTSLFVALPLFLFDPLLDWLEERSQARLREQPDEPPPTYRTKYELRQRFFVEVRRLGLDLRFGAAAAITATLLMAPLSAAMVVLMFAFLLRRRCSQSEALWLACLFGFGTALFFRTGHVNHNMFILYASFPAFCLLWPREGLASWRALLVAGFLAALCLALDYSGVIPLAVLACYAVAVRRPVEGLRGALWSCRWFALGMVPPIAFLWWSQWEMFGNPFLPAQYWMTDEHMREANFTSDGFRGFSYPHLDLFLKNLFDPAFGLYTFCPLFVLALVPAACCLRKEGLWPRRERRFTAGFLLLFLLFCSSNQYARMQWNTGFRYLVPLLPFLFLAAADVLRRLPRPAAYALTVLALFHSWLLAMARDSVPESWSRFFHGEWVQLPWLTVLQQTSRSGSLPGGRLLAPAILLLALAFVAFLWKLGQRAEEKQRGAAG